MLKNKGLIFLFLLISGLSFSQGIDQENLESEVTEQTENKERIYQIGENKRTGKDLFFISQNSPNPFTSYTSINYHLTIEVAEIKIMFYDKNNQLYRTIELDGTKLHGSLVLSRDMFEAGKYTYAFIVNGEIIDSKVLVVKD